MWNKITSLLGGKGMRKKAKNASRTDRWRFRPSLEGFEARELLSAAPIASVGGYALSNEQITISDGSTLIEGDATLPVVGQVHLRGTIQDDNHFHLTGHLDSVTVAGFVLANDNLTLSEAGVGFEGDAEMPLVGSQHLQGAIQDESHFSFNASSLNVTVGGLAVANAEVTLSGAGLAFEGDASLPMLGTTHLNGTIQPDSSFALSAQLPSATLAGLALANDSITFNNSGLTLEGDARLPLLGSAHLKGTIQSDGSGFSLGGQLPALTLGGLDLSGDTVTFTNAGITVAGDVQLPLVGSAHLTGTLQQQNGQYDLSVKLPELSIGGIIKADFQGDIGVDGSYSLKGSADIILAGFTLKGANLTLGSSSQDIQGDLAIPGFDSLGDVAFKGSYGPDGKWFLQGTYPGTVYVGAIPLDHLTLGLGNDRLTLGAHIGVPDLLDANVTGTLYTDGTFDLTGTAQVVSALGPLSPASASLEVGNANPQHLFQMILHAEVGNPLFGQTVKIDGVVDGNGNYELKGTGDLSLGGLSLANASFEVSKSTGFTFGAHLTYGFFSGEVTGTMDQSGHAHFEGDGSTGLGGFKLDKIHAAVDLDPANNAYKFDVSADANVFVAYVHFQGHAEKDAQGWHAPTLTGTAAVGGALSSILSGSATFTLAPDHVSFEGMLRIPNVPNATFDVTGTVLADGTLRVGGYAGKAGTMLAQDVAHILYEVGADAGKIASALKGIGQSFTSIASTLWNNVAGLYLQDVAGALWRAGAGLADVAYALNKGIGASLGNIAYAIRQGIGSSFTSIASALWNSGIGGFYQRDVAGALWSAGAGLADVAYALNKGIGASLGNIASAIRQGIGSSFTSIASALWNSGIGGFYQRDVAGALWNAGAGLGDIAYALNKGIGASLSNIAYAIRQGIGSSFTSIASALWNSGIGGFYQRDVAGALWNAGAGLGDIAYALNKGIGASLSNIAYAIRQGIGSSFTSIASALWNSGIGGFYQRDVAGALWNAGAGLGDVAYALNKAIGASLSNIAYAIRQGIGSSFTSIASALWNSGIGGFYQRDVAGALWNAGAGLGDVAYALNKAIGASLSNIAYAIRQGIGSSFTSIASALWNSGIGGFYQRDVAGALWSAGAGLGDVAYALNKGIGASLSNIAYAIRQGIGSSFTSIASALWNSGIGGFYLQDVAGALWNAGASLGNIASALRYGIGASFANTVSALMSAFSLSYWNAWSIVNGV